VNYVVSFIFRAIPLAMAAVCVGFGLDVWTAAGGSAADFPKLPRGDQRNPMRVCPVRRT